MIPRLAITAGEPAGIGPDLCIQLAQQAHEVDWCVIADAELLAERAHQLGLNINITRTDPDAPRQAHKAKQLRVIHTDLRAPAQAGTLNPDNASYVLKTLDVAVDGCVDGHFNAMITAPVHKGVINDAGITFTGHTEYLAERTKAHPVMMLACPGLRVALATTHLPLRDVADAITPQVLEDVLSVMHKDLNQRFGIASPRILVCGLNPHAGESGHMGREEIEVIEPTLARLRDQGMNVSEPMPADTLFTPRHLQHADAVLAMYHDQGLPVLKHMGFGNAVNITLGLPIVRTSVDHGTALELAGTGNAEVGSLEAAVATALEMI